MERPEETGYQETTAIIGALKSGMSLEEIEDALAGRAPRRGRAVLTCQVCGETGYAGEYPFSTLGGGQPCDDCA